MNEIYQQTANISSIQNAEKNHTSKILENCGDPCGMTNISNEQEKKNQRLVAKMSIIFIRRLWMQSKFVKLKKVFCLYITLRII